MRVIWRPPTVRSDVCLDAPPTVLLLPSVHYVPLSSAIQQPNSDTSLAVGSHLSSPVDGIHHVLLLTKYTESGLSVKLSHYAVHAPLHPPK